MSQNVRWTFVLRRPKRSGELDLGARTASVLHKKKEPSHATWLFLFMQCGRWDLNPHDCNNHKILSLARLPVPTLPRLFNCYMNCSSCDLYIIPNYFINFNYKFYFLHLLFFTSFCKNENRMAQHIFTSISIQKTMQNSLSYCSTWFIFVLIKYIYFIN